MKIVLSTEQDIKPIADRYLVLELDTFRIEGKEIPSWCVIDAGDIPLADMTELAHFKEQHQNLIRNYKKGDLNFVEQMLEHLQGKFGGNLDSYYTELYARLQQPKQDPWDYVVQKEAQMYQGTEHIWKNKFNSVSDLMDRYYADGKRGTRPAAEYRGALRNAARISYRVAKAAMKHQQKG